MAATPATETGKVMLPLALRGRPESCEPDPAGALSKKSKALSSRGSSNRNAYFQEPFSPALNAGPHLSSFLRFLALGSPERRGQGPQEASGDLRFVGTWTHQLSRPSVVAHTMGQYGNVGGDMALCNQCPYHHRSHDAEPINVILCRRSLHGATAPNCTCQGNFGIHGLSLGISHTRLSALDTTNGSRSQSRFDHYSDVDGNCSPWNLYDRHRRHDLSAPDSNSYTIGNSPILDATVTSPLAHGIPIISHRYGKTQSPREAPPTSSSSSFPASAGHSGDSATPYSANPSEKALAPFVRSSSSGNRRKRARRDDSRSPSRGRKPAPRDRSSTSSQLRCIYYLRDSVKYKTCENRQFPGFKTLKAHVFEHVRRFQCNRCGMRVGKEDNLKKHQRNFARRCKIRDQRAPTITPEEGERFAAIEAAEESNLENAVFHPAALFEKDSAMGARGPGSNDTPPARPDTARPPPQTPPATQPEPPSQAKTDADVTMRAMQGQITELKTVVQKHAELIDLLMSNLNNGSSKATPASPPLTSSLRDTQNLLVPSAPGSLSGHLQQENSDREAHVQKLEAEIQCLQRQLQQEREERGVLADDEPPRLQGNEGVVEWLRGEVEGSEDLNFREFIHSSLSGESEVDC
ncbi:MAG: hypothetical protein M1840_005226 [Geoglossum simile]|nr:MAG: hypothetical protein M1840_005226 [Geoglossum simile]